MESRHLFRGKRLDNGEWVEGHLFDDGMVNTNRYFIGNLVITEYSGSACDDWVIDGYDFAEVDPSTICQCTGYEGIYEKDIFQCDDERYVVKWSDDSLSWEAESIFSSETISLGEFFPEEIDVIGNEIDNPELLE